MYPASDPTPREGASEDSNPSTIHRPPPNDDEDPAVQSQISRPETVRDTSRKGDFESAREEPGAVSFAHTAVAPSFAFASPPPAPRAVPSAGALDPHALPRVGETLGDFQLVSELGRGAMGVVFLARQSSLDRQVALKVYSSAGNEARTMAVLEHRHIVQVFSETVLLEKSLRLLCMQYVAGTTLATIISTLARSGARSVEGAALLRVVDNACQLRATLDPRALRDRELLSSCDDVETTCWIGARLAEALGYAHRQGVLHRDMKPANILVDQYGCPSLADFSLSTRGKPDPHDSSSVFGGTLAYMSPEHLDAFRGENRAQIHAVDERSDIYALGVVLFEMLNLRLPFATAPAGIKGTQRLEFMAGERRKEIPAPTHGSAGGGSRPLDLVIRRSLDPDPSKRFADGESFAQALEGCRELHRRHRRLPPPGFFTRLGLRRPFLFAVFAVILPHLIGTAVNIAYNAQFIVSSLTNEQQQTFLWLVFVYNSLAYSVGVTGQAMLTLPVWYAWPGSLEVMPEEDRLLRARRFVLSWPVWAAILACLCWLPGGIFFPAMLHYLRGPVDAMVFWHFLISFFLSGLIAMTYSLASIQYLALRIFYPHLWRSTEAIEETTRSELRDVPSRLRLIQLLSGLIPLLGAALIVSIQPDHQLFDKNMFRALSVGLIAMGMAGFQLAVTACDAVRGTIAALSGGERLT